MYIAIFIYLVEYIYTYISIKGNHKCNREENIERIRKKIGPLSEMSTNKFVSMLLAIIFVNIMATGTSCLRFQTCTPEELRQQLSEVCMKWGARDTNSFLALNSFGSISEPESEGPFPNAVLINLLEESTPMRRRNRSNPNKGSMLVYRRSEEDSEMRLAKLIEKCCSEACDIDAAKFIQNCARR